MHDGRARASPPALGRRLQVLMRATDSRTALELQASPVCARQPHQAVFMVTSGTAVHRCNCARLDNNRIDRLDYLLTHGCRERISSSWMMTRPLCLLAAPCADAAVDGRVEAGTVWWRLPWCTSGFLLTQPPAGGGGGGVCRCGYCLLPSVRSGPLMDGALLYIGSS
jgi:hypothetical protein